MEEPSNSVNRKALAEQTRECLMQIEEDAKNCTTAVKELIQKVKSKELESEDGLSFLEMKNHTVLSYLISLSGLIQEKVRGKSIQGSSYIRQLVESRTVLEKIRPIDIKLKYKVDKLVRSAAAGKAESEDPLRFRANPDNLNTDRNGDEGMVDEEDEIGQKESDPDSEINSDLEDKSKRRPKIPKGDGIYRPPRVAPQHFEETTSSGRKKTDDDRRKRKAFSGTLIRELQEEFLDTPVEIHNMGDAYAKRLSRETKDREKYEETYMTRLPMTKADKHREQAMSTIGVLGDELTDFSGRGRSASSKRGTKRKFFAGKGRGKGIKKKFRK